MYPSPQFRRGGFGQETPPSSPDPENFVSVPAIFTQGLAPEQWKALQQTYAIAWEHARKAAGGSGEAGWPNYEI